jgi:ubiquinone/menaquinone biosynthesis C-methylase UbiE
MQSMYEKVGKYDQDRVNGFDENLIGQYIEHCEIIDGMEVLDAMAGDGNLSLKVMDKHPNIKMITTDISSVQCELAKDALGGRSTVLELDLTAEESNFENIFDLVMIKSGNHEIPFDLQLNLYKNIFKALRPGGKFVNLGILLRSDKLRDEINFLNRYRSEMADAMKDIQNRHFLTCDEFYTFLEDAGFCNVKARDKFFYTIDMGVLTSEYLENDPLKRIIMNGVVSQMKEFRSQKLADLNTDWSVKFPGEITIAHKPFNQ